MKVLSVLIVDDSALGRQLVASMLAESPHIAVVGRASGGEEALKMALTLRPDVITLDLEMPGMDGFAFLRLLFARWSVPVIVVSSQASHENVFRALELGAIDFVAKPGGDGGSSVQEVSEALRGKIEHISKVSPSALGAQHRRLGSDGRDRSERPSSRPPPVRSPSTAARRLLAIGASTGGPVGIVDLIRSLPPIGNYAVAVVQHMPERFTASYATRLDRLGVLSFAEAVDGMPILGGGGVVCPGGRCLLVETRDRGAIYRVVKPADMDRYVPSVDRFLLSAAACYGSRLTAAILTGMGDDGAEGVRAVKGAGGTVLAEAPETAVMYGMPSATVHTGVADAVLPRGALGSRIGQILSAELA
ncbi:MAG: chemotaxis-specific protein-glutamate methyltransferase CheB [Myxococcales bacterium]|nr:chemotaxis-specific protein-glutamate methyltransferase CheB [Myxococcales bacterium]